MNLYRITYSNGFWGDEIAATITEARVKGCALAADNGVAVVSVRKVRCAK